jgi:hypothetical protein
MMIIYYAGVTFDHPQSVDWTPNRPDCNTSYWIVPGTWELD